MVTRTRAPSGSDNGDCICSPVALTSRTVVTNQLPAYRTFIGTRTA